MTSQSFRCVRWYDIDCFWRLSRYFKLFYKIHFMHWCSGWVSLMVQWFKLRLTPHCYWHHIGAVVEGLSHVSVVQGSSLGEAGKRLTSAMWHDSSLIAAVWAKEWVSLSSRKGDSKELCSNTSHRSAWLNNMTVINTCYVNNKINVTCHGNKHIFHVLVFKVFSVHCNFAQTRSCLGLVILRVHSWHCGSAGVSFVACNMRHDAACVSTENNVSLCPAFTQSCAGHVHCVSLCWLWSPDVRPTPRLPVLQSYSSCQEAVISGIGNMTMFRLFQNTIIKKYKSSFTYNQYLTIVLNYLLYI